MSETVTRELSETIENIEAQSGAAFHRCTPSEYAAKLGIETRNVGSATLLSVRKSNSLYFNRVLGLGLASQTSMKQIEQILDYYAGQKIEHFAIELSPLAKPNRIANWLERRGFHESEGTAKMINQRVLDGLELGCSWFTSETVAPKPHNPLISHRNLCRAGFEMAYVRGKYVWEA